ncbi:MAG TPA: bifunctional phosphoribosylaminoimidazolecarboxamide formyltransferase/IMP cyclohydrolase [Chitinophagaceae bacterium]|nr:bifunctional phosphoribosylaminoimidazolecarboxamide formyltransferase/IMP cyclohydrolase [Chitinophagaceae bacterium]
MQKKIQSALISVFYKDGLEPLLQTLHQQGVTIYSTGGTREFIESLNVPCIPVEDVTQYPSILGGRVKTLHPKIFGGILGRRDLESDRSEMKEYAIPEIDLVIVDLYPFEETVASTNEEQKIIEKIDIGGPSMIRAAAKNFNHLAVLSSKNQYQRVQKWLMDQDGCTTLEQRRQLATEAFEVVRRYDHAIADYFSLSASGLRYGENPHQKACFSGALDQIFTQLHGKELSYNNLVDVDAAIQLVKEFENRKYVFAIIKHTNVCGASCRNTVEEAWQSALAGDPESAFGGVLVCNGAIDAQTASAIQEIFFEVLLAPDFSEEALQILQQKKNRILLQYHPGVSLPDKQSKSILNGFIIQETDRGNVLQWDEQGGRTCTDSEKNDLEFANVLCKHLKSNAIALVKNVQLLGKGCGQTSRIDALRQAIDKAGQHNAGLQGAVLASDAFFPFDDCVRMAHAAGIQAFIQPGGSIRDKDSIEYCRQHQLAMVLTGMRHFKH